MNYNDNLNDNINLGGLGRAQQLDDVSQRQLTKNLTSAICGQNLTFTGIVTSVENMGVDDSRLKNFRLMKMQYVFSGIGNTTKLTYRRMYCMINIKPLDALYRSIYGDEFNTLDMDYSNIPTMVKVTGIMKITGSGKPILAASKIEHCTPASEHTPYDMDRKSIYDILHDTVIFLKTSDARCIYNNKNDLGYIDIPDIVTEYCDYEVKYEKKIKKGKTNKAMEIQMEQLDNTFRYIDKHCNRLTISADKIRLILEDIAMMHTSIQTEEYDQLGVLYDCNCLYAMNESAFALERLLSNKNVTFEAKDIIIILLVYFKKFYSDYLLRLSVTIPEKNNYRKYEHTINDMLEEIGFDINLTSNVFSDIEYYVYKLTHSL